MSLRLERTSILRIYLTTLFVLLNFLGCKVETPDQTLALKDSLNFECRLVSETETPMKQMGWDGSTAYYLKADTFLTRAHLAAVHQIKDANNVPALKLTLTPDGAKIFAEATAQHVNQKIAISVAGKVINAPVIREKIAGGVLMLTLKNQADEVIKAFTK